MKLRFAPAPTGLLHVGQARIALANWLLARRHGGRFLLRLDDIGDRSRADYADGIEHDLAWLGLDWDEHVRQSDRLDRYAAAADRLRAAGRLYPCFESDDELNFKRELRHRQGRSTIYDRAMLKMTAAQRAQAEAGGKVPYWRFLLSGKAAEWDDTVGGRQSVKLSALSDPVLVRADGTPLPSFASVVDDLELGITHVVRGADHLVNTGIQLDILAALGAPPQAIRFAHLPLLLTDGAGRRGPPSLRSLRTDGIEPAALAGTLARLGTADAPAPEPAVLLAARYDLGRIGPDTPRFDPQTLLAVNRRALADMPFEAARDRLPPAATPAFWHAVRGSLDLMREARGWWDVVAGTIVPPLVEGETEFLQDALAVLPPEPWDDGTWPAWLGALATASGLAGDEMDAPLRLALTGEEDGPPLRDLLPLMGRARVAERLRLAAT